MPPRYGLMKYVIDAAHTTGARNLHVLPVAINYDLIGEVSDYAREESGVKKKAESLSWFVGYLRGLSQPMGRIYIDIGDPVVLEKVPSGEDTAALQKTAFQVGVEVNKITPITLPSLITMILLGAAPRALTRDEALSKMESLIIWARERGIRVTSDFDMENQEHMNGLVDVVVENGLVTRYDDGPEIVYAIAPDQHVSASYYRNTMIHHFINKAIIELSLAYAKESEANDRLQAFWAETERLRDLFKFEFFYAPTDEFRDQLREELNRCQPGWESDWSNDLTYIKALIKNVGVSVARGSLLSFVEAYRVSAEILARVPDGEALDEKECIKKSLAYGRQALLQQRITSEASIGKQLFENSFKLMSNMGLTEAGDSALIERRKQHSKSMRELAHRLDRLQTLSIL